MPTVSVILPTYNRAHAISRAIQSVLNQTYRDFELVVVDDGSTDNTESVVKDFGDPRIRYIRCEQNRGGSAARNIGIKAAEGEFIAFQDSDDEWMQEKLKKQMSIFERASLHVGVVYTGFYRIKNNDKTYIPTSDIKISEGNIHDQLLKGNFVSTPTAIVRAECFKRAGLFDERLPRLQDWELFIRISDYYIFRFLNEPLVFQYFSQYSISSNQGALIRALEQIMKTHFLPKRNSRKLISNMQYLIGNNLCKSGNMQEGRMYLFQALKSHPLDMKHTAAAIASLFGGRYYINICRLKQRLTSIEND